MWMLLSVLILLLNALAVVNDVRNGSIGKVTLLNAFAAGVLLTSLSYQL